MLHVITGGSGSTAIPRIKSPVLLPAVIAITIKTAAITLALISSANPTASRVSGTPSPNESVINIRKINGATCRR